MGACGASCMFARSTIIEKNCGYLLAIVLRHRHRRKVIRSKPVVVPTEFGGILKAVACKWRIPSTEA